MQPDQLRMESWVRDHAASVRGFVLAMVRRHDVADDLVQEVFRRAWQARDRYAESGTARAYLLCIADRLVCDRARRNQNEITIDDNAWRKVEPSDHEANPPHLLAAQEQRQALEAALESLSMVQRRVLLLRYYGEMSFAEIAAALDCPLSTALSHCHRGLTALRKIMSEEPS